MSYRTSLFGIPLAVSSMLLMTTPILGFAQGAKTVSTPDTAVMVVDLTGTPKQDTLARLLKVEVAKAVALRRTPVVELGAPWCSRCQQIKQLMGNPSLIDAFSGIYLIRLDVDEWNNNRKQLASALGLEKGRQLELPTFFPVDSVGKVTDTEGILTDGELDDIAKSLKVYFADHRWPFPKS